MSVGHHALVVLWLLVSLFSPCDDKHTLADGEAATWPCVVFPRFFLFGCCGLLCDWPSMQWSLIVWVGNLRVSGTGVHDPIHDCFSTF